MFIRRIRLNGLHFWQNTLWLFPCPLRACLCLAMFCFFAIAGQSKAWADPASEKNKKALVLACFGTTVEQPKDPLAEIKAVMAQRFPGTPVYVAYTSLHVARSLSQRGEEALLPTELLGKLGKAGFEQVLIQSLHLIPGQEFDTLKLTAAYFASLPKGFKKIALGAPLLASAVDATQVADILKNSLPPERNRDEAVLFVGHGSDSSGSLAYPALQAELWKKDSLLFVGVIEGTMDLKTLSELLKTRKVKTVWLVPLLGLVGEHAQNDIFGSDGQSWRIGLQKSGFTVLESKQGLFSLPGIARIFADHAQAASRSW